jgi:aminoglycoside 6'-N-acetyltransferase I
MIERCAFSEQAGWLALRGALWPGSSKDEHLAEMRQLLAQPERFAQFVVYGKAWEPAGFVEAAIRNDYVNGTKTKPVAFLEGIYVASGHRRQGVARTLLAAVAEWATRVAHVLAN